MSDASTPQPNAAPPRFDAVVVGAGISGLTAAYRLQRAGRSVQLLEAAARPGGVIGSVRARRLPVRARAEQHARHHAADRRAGRRPGAGFGRCAWPRRPPTRATCCATAGCTALPTSPAAFFSTPLFSAAAKLALLREPFVAPAPAERRGDGRRSSCAGAWAAEFLDYAIDPFVAGIYAGDPESDLGARGVSRGCIALEQRYGSLIRGQILGARERRRKPERVEAGGAELLLRATACRASPTRFARRWSAAGCGPRHGIGATPGRWAVDGRRRERPMRFRRGPARCLAVPAGRGGALAAPHAAAAAAALDAIPYPPVASVARAYARGDVAHALDGFGFLVPRQGGAPHPRHALLQQHVRGPGAGGHGAADHLRRRACASPELARTSKIGKSPPSVQHELASLLGVRGPAAGRRRDALAARDSAVHARAPRPRGGLDAARARPAGPVLLRQLPRRHVGRRLHPQWPSRGRGRRGLAAPPGCNLGGPGFDPVALAVGRCWWRRRCSARRRAPGPWPFWRR